MSRSFLRNDGWFQPVGPGDIQLSTTTTTGFLTYLTNATTADIALVSTGTYVDGPSVSQGSSGTWFVSGGIFFDCANSANNIAAKLWDGATLLSVGIVSLSAGFVSTMSLSGIITSPSGNLRISAAKGVANTATIRANLTVVASTLTTGASYITAIRIG